MTMHSIVAGTSLVLHAVVRPYEDVAGNVVVVLFTLCELLGALGEMTVTGIDQPSIQWAHVIVLLIALVVLFIFGLNAFTITTRDINASQLARGTCACAC